MTEPTTHNSPRLFLITILTGSFLLFLVQPMIARMALPRLGGAPAVWNSAMLVYQALLLAGYAYAHRLAREPARRQAVVHLAMFAVALLWLPIGLAAFHPPADGSPIFWVPWLLVASIGPLFFVVAAQAPLMQRWYALSGNKGEPYALYAASNIGSFAGLIAYPLVVEPFTTLNSQKWIWSGIYLALMALVAICARNLWQTRSQAQASAVEAPPQEASGINWKRRLYWIALAAVPSGLMLSTTSHLTTDLMAMPLLWVIPLGIYLLSFSVAFADDRMFANIFTRMAPVVLVIAGSFVFIVWGKAAINGMVASLSLLFVVAVSLHAEMYRTRPAPNELTSFYLMMSVGGVIGGLFCAILAPLVFNWTWEHPILILAAAVLMPKVGLIPFNHENRKIIATMAVIGAIALALGVYGAITYPDGITIEKVIIAAIIMTLAIATAGFRVPFLLAVAGLLTVNGGWDNLKKSTDGSRMRSYFGTYTVSDSGNSRWLMHGTTLHGMQLRDEPTRPISYYPVTSGVGIAFAKAPELFGPNASIGVVGLGTGTLACYRKPGQYWQFFEIDPLMIEIAREKRIFSFLERCAPDIPITLGDARLTLAAVPEGKFDILALDAFSSDSIPLHLLTKEAFATYRRALKPNGLLLVHISNRYIDLNPVVAAEAKANGWFAALRHDSPTEALMNKGDRASQWIALSADKAKLAQLTGKLDTVKNRYHDTDQWLAPDPPGKTSPWTDDYASVLPHLSLWKII